MRSVRSVKVAVATIKIQVPCNYICSLGRAHHYRQRPHGSLGRECLASEATNRRRAAKKRGISCLLMVYYALSEHLAGSRKCSLLLAMKMTRLVRPPLRGQRYSVMPVNDPTIDIVRIDRHAATAPGWAGPGRAEPEPRQAVSN
ncbi:hypothetical protein ALC57_06521 [Trachymyrmex cornetzi]|uniref:Uncharacterized protein n=1 Tax=Trachymyrmex cornetzi TaxID=471704 RepID=A0A151J8J0_9HYME|nr:hypothetical protein ALC57_06521 [Trachymyrmex cornetzi]